MLGMLILCRLFASLLRLSPDGLFSPFIKAMFTVTIFFVHATIPARPPTVGIPSWNRVPIIHARLILIGAARDYNNYGHFCNI